ncbi:hypothetical protein AXF42_Ash019956 [Apostasia shenzhenica]|uniref:Uncharacterized protein n=1 Tax=Apostasia shenzhenica TaxID=1088818 RepID=A0A2I0AZJ8_9ASPA|nr:hypothetical protein AXF42_Ash019956 [Apostasia shenzhenica]
MVAAPASSSLMVAALASPSQTRALRRSAISALPSRAHVQQILQVSQHVVHVFVLGRQLPVHSPLL